MKQPETPGIYVAESDVMSSAHWAPQWFNKVVGVVLPNGEPHFTHRRLLDGYVARAVRHVEFDADAAILDGTARFIDRYMQQPRISGDDPYNCHSYADWMTGAATPNPLSIQGVDPSALDQGRNLASGERGYVLGGSEHSVVGLGEQVPACIQVVAYNGNLGVLTYDDVTDIYGAPPLPLLPRPADVSPETITL